MTKQHRQTGDHLSSSNGSTPSPSLIEQQGAGTIPQYAVLGIGAEAWVELRQVEAAGVRRRNVPTSGVTLNWRTFQAVMNVLRNVRFTDFAPAEQGAGTSAGPSERVQQQLELLAGGDRFVQHTDFVGALRKAFFMGWRECVDAHRALAAGEQPHSFHTAFEASAPAAPSASLNEPKEQEERQTARFGSTGPKSCGEGAPRRCARCRGTGTILSETCDSCVDCQDPCPICGGSGTVVEPEMR